MSRKAEIPKILTNQYLSAANTSLTGQYKAKSNSMKMSASLGRTYPLQNQTQNETVHVIFTGLSDANMHGAYTSMSMIRRKEVEERRWKANLRPAQASIDNHKS